MQRALTSVDLPAGRHLLRKAASFRAVLRAAAIAVALAAAAGARAADPRATLDDAWREFFFQMCDKADRLCAPALRETAAAPALRAEAEIGAAMLAQFRETGGDIQRAVAVYERLLNSGLQWPPRALCLSMLAEAYATQQRDAEADRQVRATVEVIEPRGSETYLYLSAGGRDFIARVDAGSRAAVGQPIVLTARMERAHFFDTGSGAAIV